MERPEPSITAQDEIKIRIIRVGICGTDREEVSGGRADAPDGQKELVIGHEMFGQVVGVGIVRYSREARRLRRVHRAAGLRRVRQLRA